MFISLFAVTGSFAQNGVAINTTGAAANNSAMLDITSTTAGLLIPRMISSERTTIPSPATGLLVYQTDGLTGFYYYNGSAWTLLSNSASTVTGVTASLPLSSSGGVTPNISLTGIVPVANGGTGVSNNALALSIFGNFTNAAASPSFNAASADGQFLVRRGTALTFGAILPSDLPAGSGNYIINSSSLQTPGTFNIAGSGSMVGLTSSNASINLNVNSAANITNINTGTTTGNVNIGGGGTGQIITVGGGANAQTLNLGSTITAGTSTINLGTNADGVTTTILSGAAGVNINNVAALNRPTNINTNSSTGTLSLGNTSNTTNILSGTTNIKSSSGGVNINTTNSQPTNINTGTNNTGTVTIGGTANTTNQTINIGGSGLQTINVGTIVSGGGIVTIGSTGGDGANSTTIVRSGNGGVNINAGLNQPTNINTGTSNKDVTIGNTNSNLILPKFTTAGSILYSSTVGGIIAATAAGTSGQVLTSSGGGAPVWAAGATGTVTSVTASSPLSSSGGATPNITLSGIVPIASGGTNIGTIGSAGSVIYSNGTQHASTAVGTAGQVLTSNGAGIPTWATAANGTVTIFNSGNLPPLFTTSVANPTTTPALSFSLSSADVNKVFAGPASGTLAALPTFRALVAADIPSLAGNYIVNSSTLQSPGTFNIAGSGSLVGLTNTNALLSSGGAISLNNNSAFTTSINTGTSTGGVTIGGTGTQTIALGSTGTTSATNIVSGSGGVNINTGINTGTVTIGSTGNQIISIGSSITNGTITLGNSANDPVNTNIFGGIAGGVNINNNVSKNLPTNINTGATTGNVTIGSVNNNLILPKFLTNSTIFYTTGGTGTVSGLTPGSNGQVLTLNAGLPSWATPTSGTVTTFSSSSLFPLFSTSVVNANTTPALSFILSSAAANTVFGNFTNASATPSFNVASADGQFLVRRSGALTFGTINSGDLPSLAGNYIVNSSVLQSSANFNISGNGTIGANLSVAGTSTLTGAVTSNAGITSSGGAISLNNNSNFATNINTGTSIGTVTIGSAANNVNLPKLTASAVVLTDGSKNLTAATLLPIANGGTNTNAAPTNGGVAYGTGSAYAFTTVGTTGQVLTSNGSGAPTWATSTNGTVTTFSSNDLSPLFTTSVATANSTPDLSFSLSNAAAYTVFGNHTLSSAAPTFGKLDVANEITGILPIANGGTNSTTMPTAGAIAYGTGGAYAFTAAGISGQVLTSNAAGAPTWTAAATGTVTSVALALPDIFSVSGSPVTTSGTLTGVLTTQNANLVFAGPPSGAGAAPTFRALVSAYLPAGSNSYIQNQSASSQNASYWIDGPARIGTSAFSASGQLNVETSGASNNAIVAANTAAAGTGAGDGIEGSTDQSQGAGVRGVNTNISGTGIIATGGTTGVYAKYTNAGDVGEAIYTENGDALPAVVRVNYFNGTTQYKIVGDGTVSTTAENLDNTSKVVLHAPEAPEILFEDYGEGKLINGKAHINIDPTFSKNVSINDKHPLRVFIQLEGDCNGVYVANKTKTGFDE